jgi:hypothetical protein
MGQSWRLRTLTILRAIGFDAHEFSDLAVPIAIASFPLAWLALLEKSFYTDWNNHLWIIGYTGEYFRHHFSFPLTLNTDQRIGITFPLFYGTLFYPLAGIISAFTGAAIALRLVLFAVMWLQASEITKLVRTVYSDRYVAWAVAGIVSFGVYPLTNLYNRSAITEFVAASLLVSACSLWLRAIYTGLPRGWVSASLAWLLVVLSAGTHPITALVGGAFWGLLVVGSLFTTSDRRFAIRMTLAHVVASLLVLSPWLYVTLKFYKHLMMSTFSQQVVVFSDSIDLPWSRLLPIPFDIRPLFPASFSPFSTPYLEAQINFGLLIAVCFLGFYSYTKLRTGNMSMTAELIAVAVCLGVALLVLYCSVSTHLWLAAPSFLGMIQFAYRLVTYCDLLLYLAVVLLLSTISKFRVEIRNKLQICLAIALVLMAQSVLIKFAHAASVQTNNRVPGTGLFENRRALTQLPGSFYGLDGYVSREGFAPNLHGIPTVRLHSKGGVDFGTPESALAGPPGWFATNIQAFPWNRLVLNGKAVPKAATHISSDTILSPLEFPAMAVMNFIDDTLAARTDSAHTLIGYRFVPHRSYLVFRFVSGAILISWSAILLIGACYGGWGGIRCRGRAPSTKLRITKIVFATIRKRVAYWGLVLIVLGAAASILQAIARHSALPPSVPPVSASLKEQTALIATIRAKFNHNIPLKGRKPDPLLVTGSAAATDITSVEYLAPDSIRLHINHGQTASAKSRVIRIRPRDTYLLEVVEGEDRVVVKLNGREEVRFNGTSYPTANEEVSFGKNRPGNEITTEEFSGQLLSSSVNRIGDHPPIMLATLEIVFPRQRSVNPHGDPLVVTGVPGAGDLVSVRYEGGDQVRFQIDHWGIPPVVSAVLTATPGKTYVLEVRDDANSIVVSLNDREVARYDGKAFPTTRAQITLGSNRIGGGTTTTAFTGKILTSTIYLR